MKGLSAKNLLRRAWFAGMVTAGLFIAAMVGFHLGWQQIKKPLLVALTFHGVTEKPSLPWEIHPQKLQDYISQFKRYEYAAVDPASLSNMLNNGFQGRNFLMTFDDGLLTSAATIKTLYRDHGIKSGLFIVMDLLGTPGYVDKEALLDLQNNYGCLIGLHGRRHYEVSKIINEGGNLSSEIEQARTDLSAMLHCIVDWYAYPFGDYNASAVASIASTGVNLAFTIEGAEITPGQHRMTMPRVMYLKGAREAGEPAIENWLPPSSSGTGSLTITLSLLVGFLGLSWFAKLLNFVKAFKAAQLREKEA
ncbi:MAG TPA: polysaccharide deacetylase family protein [Candidatus Rifleibacterium sp.]|nr:polysaccharide deacetylase family protein [Candidatus Rifleibacterium sp.]HPT44924.1 polysaccharide deacetylase family protein [Candidatus Rifleibacterium sp.]